MITKDYVSLHPEYGGPAKGFRCEAPVFDGELWRNCGKVTRTESGMKMHLRKVHGIKLQGDLFGKPTEEASTAAEGTAGVQEAQPELQPGVDAEEEKSLTPEAHQ